MDRERTFATLYVWCGVKNVPVTILIGVWVLLPTPERILGHQESVQGEVDSLLTLCTQRWHQIPQIQGSVLWDCSPHFGCQSQAQVCFPCSRPTAKAAPRTQRNILLTRSPLYGKRTRAWRHVGQMVQFQLCRISSRHPVSNMVTTFNNIAVCPQNLRRADRKYSQHSPETGAFIILPPGIIARHVWISKHLTAHLT